MTLVMTAFADQPAPVPIHRLVMTPVEYGTEDEAKRRVLDTLVSTLVIDSGQRAGEIVFSIEIENRGAAALTLQDPTDRIRVTLFDSKGQRCSLDVTPPRWYGQRSPRPRGGAGTNDETRREYVVDRSPQPAVSEGVKAVQDMVDEEVTLAPGERFRFVVRVPKILANPREHAQRMAEWDPRDPQSKKPKAATQSVPTGRYELEITLLLSLKEPRASAHVGSGRIPVQVGSSSIKQE